jgi:hypothetical protein
MDILALMGVMNTTGEIDEYIKGKYTGSPVTGVMVVSAASVQQAVATTTAAAS